MFHAVIVTLFDFDLSIHVAALQWSRWWCCTSTSGRTRTSSASRRAASSTSSTSSTPIGGRANSTAKPGSSRPITSRRCRPLPSPTNRRPPPLVSHSPIGSRCQERIFEKSFNRLTRFVVRTLHGPGLKCGPELKTWPS